jgi:PqqD family protein of HPr-rel-A system
VKSLSPPIPAKAGIQLLHPANRQLDSRFRGNDEVCFVADPPEARLSVELDGFTLVFHRASGITHMLAAPAPELLEALAEGPAEAAELLERLAARHHIDDPAEAETVIAARLAELEEAGLVSRQ